MMNVYSTASTDHKKVQIWSVFSSCELFFAPHRLEKAMKIV